MYQILSAALLFAATSLAAPVPNPQLGVTVSTPLGGLAVGTPSVTNPQPPRPYYDNYRPSSYPVNYSPVSVLPGALTSTIGDIASDVAYGIGDSIARGSGPRPGYYDSPNSWNRPGSGYGYNSNGWSNYGRGYRREDGTVVENKAEAQVPEAKPAEDKPAAAAAAPAPAAVEA